LAAVVTEDTGGQFILLLLNTRVRHKQLHCNRRSPSTLLSPSMNLIVTIPVNTGTNVTIHIPSDACIFPTTLTIFLLCTSTDLTHDRK